MANDFKKKELSKNERVIYELAMQMHDIDHRLWSTSSHLLALGVMLKVDPKKMAEILTDDGNKLKEYAQAISTEIERIEKEKGPKDSAAPEAHGHDHEHNHDHSDPNHTH